ncbi:uncharacterized protein LOC143233069 isoform X2 [Tachypleus tridentatus]|uniref:uncharacterized protein LOC143233069 isoform X2 n=1 Tax=Tachypleus tridentatus TaxID=6853 RepID=UPI003FCFBFFA
MNNSHADLMYWCHLYKYNNTVCCMTTQILQGVNGFSPKLMASELEGQKDLKELVLASIYQANQLTSVLNEGLRVSEDDMFNACSGEVVGEESNNTHAETSVVARKTGLLLSLPLPKLINISCTINRHLTQLLSYVSEREEERL